MKKTAMALCIALLVLSIPAEAAVDSIYEYLKRVDNNYAVVVGTNGKAAESFAASDIVIGLKLALNVDLEPTIESLVSPQENKILVGHPCGNSLIKMKCTEWPYDEGEAIIKIMDNDLVVAGTTPEDTQAAAKVVATFKGFPILKQTKAVLVRTNMLDPEQLELEIPKSEQDFVCGDGICETGEKFFCASDCQQKSCFTQCIVQGLDVAYCRDPTSHPKVPACKGTEISQGTGYCASGKICCCGTEQMIPENESIPLAMPTPEEEPGLLERILAWLKEFLSVIF